MVTLSVKFGNRGESEAGGEQLGARIDNHDTKYYYNFKAIKKK
jgi:hypothetical protein